MSPGWRQLTAQRVINFTPLWWLARDSNWGWRIIIVPRITCCLYFSESGSQHQSLLCNTTAVLQQVLLVPLQLKTPEWSPRFSGTTLSQRPQFKLVTGLSYVDTVLSNAIRKARQRKAQGFLLCDQGFISTQIQNLLQAIMQLLS